MILLGGSIAHVTPGPALGTRYIVLLRPVLVISHRYFYMTNGVLLMLFN